MSAHRPTPFPSPRVDTARRGVPLGVLVTRGQMLASMARSTGVTDLARLSRSLQQALLSSTLSPAERTMLLDAALSAVPPQDAVTLAVALVHALDTAALRRFGRGGLVRLRVLCTSAPVWFADVAVRRLEAILASTPRFRLHTIDGLTIATRGLGVLSLAAVWKSVLERTQRLREHGILRDVVMVIRPDREEWTDPPVLEGDLRLSALDADAPAAASLRAALCSNNLLFTDWGACGTPPAPWMGEAVPALVCIARAVITSSGPGSRAHVDGEEVTPVTWLPAS